MTPCKIKIIISSSVKNIPLVGAIVNKLCSFTPLSELESYKIELCVVEACNNSIEHAYKNQCNHEIEIEISLSIDQIKFQICDYGKPMNGQIKVTKFEFDPNDIKNLPEGGMGLYIMNCIMDEVRYQRGRGKNILTLVKKY